MDDLRATLCERLRDPRAIPIVARYAIPVLGVFVLGWSVLETVAAGILTFAVAVPAFMLLPLVQRAGVDARTLLTSGWLPCAFGFMVLCQIPSFVNRVRHLEKSGVAPEKMGMDLETGFVLHRTAMLTAMASIPTRPAPKLRRWRRRKN